MNITVTHTFAPEVLEFFTAITRGLANGIQPPPSTNGEVKKPVKEAPAASTKAEKTEAPKAEKQQGDKNEAPLTIEAIRSLVNETVTKGDEQKSAVKALLVEFNAKSVSNLPPDQFESFVEKLKAVA